MRTFLNVLMMGMVFLLSSCTTSKSQCDQNIKSENNSWYKYNNSDTVFIFVHGIFSNAKSCWEAPNCAYWPELISNDKRFKNPSIYLGGFYTAAASGSYKIRNASDELFSSLNTTSIDSTPAVLKKRNIVFVAHSTGGIIVRHLLVNHSDAFKDKNVGLVLFASPSTGSEWADRTEVINSLLGNDMANELHTYSPILEELDPQFSSLVQDKKIKKLVGAEAFENKFIIRGIFQNTSKVVNVKDTQRYFGPYEIIPDSDHFSIVKPTGETGKIGNKPHEYLWNYYENKFLPSLRLNLVKIVGSNEDYRDYKMGEMKFGKTSVQYLRNTLPTIENEGKIKVSEYTTYYGDTRFHNEIVNDPPAILIMHASAFFDKQNADDSVKVFQTMIDRLYDELPDTKFIIFSRVPGSNPGTEICNRWNSQKEFLRNEKFKDRLVFYTLTRENSEFTGSPGLDMDNLASCWTGQSASVSCDKLIEKLNNQSNKMIENSTCVM